jgi:hypothetical protein
MKQIKQKQMVQHLAGCGLRRQGKVYMYSDMKKHLEKYPFGYFLYDPPILIEDPANWGICPQGISYIFKDGVYHAVDWIGVNNYPNASDILEEAFQVGGSGLVPLNLQLDKLTMGKSRRLLVHPHGWLQNNQPYKREYQNLPQVPECFRPIGSRQHKKPSVNEPCASLHWQTVEGGNVISERYVQRTVGSTTYNAVAPLTTEKPVFSLAIIGWLPIDELHVVNSEDKSDLDKALDLLKNLTSDMPVFLTNC